LDWKQFNLVRTVDIAKFTTFYFTLRLRSNKKRCELLTLNYWIVPSSSQAFLSLTLDWTPRHNLCNWLKVRSHQKRNFFFARPNPMKSQRPDACGCDRRDIFPGGAFGATRCGRRVYSELKYFNFEAVIS